VVLAAWVVVPLSSSPPSQPEAAVATVPPEPAAPELDAINREVDRLRERLSEPARHATPTRDPFQFVASPSALAVMRPAEPASLAPPEPPEPAIAWPSLVAIVAGGNDVAPTFQAVLEDASDIVRLRSVGETVGDIVVTDITVVAVTLTHTPSGDSTLVALR
jgi:hypothetical protein